jgi:hypothetical protein
MPKLHADGPNSTELRSSANAESGAIAEEESIPAATACR